MSVTGKIPSFRSPRSQVQACDFKSSSGAARCRLVGVAGCRLLGSAGHRLLGAVGRLLLGAARCCFVGAGGCRLLGSAGCRLLGAGCPPAEPCNVVVVVGRPSTQCLLGIMPRQLSAPSSAARGLLAAYGMQSICGQRVARRLASNQVCLNGRRLAAAVAAAGGVCASAAPAAMTV